MTNITDVFFDLDNTLWDFRTNSQLALTKMFTEYKIKEKYQIDFDEWHEFYYHKNEELWAALRDKLIGKNDLRERRFKETFGEFGITDQLLINQFNQEYLQRVTEENHLVAGALELLQYLQPKYRLHVLTNGFHEVSYRKIRGAKIEDFFTSITTADELGIRKPDLKIFAHSLQKSNAKKEESVYIGDDYVADVIGATAFGMRVIFYNALQQEINNKDTIVVNELSKIKSIL